MKLQTKIKYRVQLRLLRSRKFHKRLRGFLLTVCIVCVIILSSLLGYHKTEKTRSQQQTFVLNTLLFRKFPYTSREEYPLPSKSFFLNTSSSSSVNLPVLASDNTHTFGNNVAHFSIKSYNTQIHRKANRVVQLSAERINVTLFSKTEFFFEDDFVIEDAFLKYWTEKKTVLCDGKFQGYANMFVRWINITIDASKSRGAVGGENVTQVLKQKESNELLNPKKGFFIAECTWRPKYTFLRYTSNNRGHLPTWLKVIRYSQGARIYQHPQIDTISNFTIIIPRNEYANLYHSMNDLFNVFLLHVFFHKNPQDSVIIFADGHPKGHIDPIWEKLFGSVIRVRHLQKPTRFKELIWTMMEKFSPLNLFDLKQVSYIDHFRTFVFRKYGIVPRKSPDCKNINVLFIWRHDYLAHPRNPKGKITRKIKNEEELFNYTKISFPEVKFRSADLATLVIEEQLKLISESDIIIAMHGAGLTLELFLPPKGGVIELLPMKLRNFSDRQLNLFKVITDRIPLHYIQWQNKDKKNEVSVDYTIIPPSIVNKLLKQMLSKICQQNESNIKEN